MAEVLVSFLIFTIGIVSALTLMNQTTRITSITKNQIVASNLAQEGIEAVKNIRDTNWLVYSSNLRECWHFSPDTDKDADVDSSDAVCTPDLTGQNAFPIGEYSSGTRIRSFLVDFDSANSRWFLLPAPEYLDTSVSPQVFTDYILGNENGEVAPVLPVGGRRARLYLDGDNRYTHYPTGNTASEFYRLIDIYYVDNPDSGQDELFPAQSSFATAGEGAWRDNRIKIVAKIYWTDPFIVNGFRSFELETIMTDYLNRSNWTE